MQAISSHSHQDVVCQMSLQQTYNKKRHWKLQSDWLIKSRFYVPPDTKYVISETFFPANLLAKYWKTKTNTTKQTCIRNKIYYNTKWTQKTKAKLGYLQPPAWKQTEPILVSALHKFVAYLLLRHLPTYLQPRNPHRAKPQSGSLLRHSIMRQYNTSEYNCIRGTATPQLHKVHRITEAQWRMTSEHNTWATHHSAKTICKSQTFIDQQCLVYFTMLYAINCKYTIYILNSIKTTSSKT